MDYLWIIAVVALIFLPPALLLRPLVLAIANRIAGRNSDPKEVKRLQERVEALEQQINGMQHRLIVVEDASEFSKRLLEDVAKERGGVGK